jgi:hypothetical protein
MSRITWRRVCVLLALSIAVAQIGGARAELRFLDQGGVALIEITGAHYDQWAAGRLTGRNACVVVKTPKTCRCIGKRDRLSADARNERRAAVGATPEAPCPPMTGDLGSYWIEKETEWTGTWTRSAGTGTSSTSWRAVWKRPGDRDITASLHMTFTPPNQVRITRTDDGGGPTAGLSCTYTGAITGNAVSGTYICTKFTPKPLTWTATMHE